MKSDGSGDTENSEVHFKVVRGEIQGPIPTQRGFGALLPTHHFDNSPLQAALRAEGCQLESGVAEAEQLARSGGSLGWGSLKTQRDFFFFFSAK